MELLMGNEAMALGAMHAGVQIVTGYPGTPSSEVLEYVSAQNVDRSIYVEWSVNEKAAVEVAAGGSYGGKRALVTMKQVGLNAASDPLMNLAYIGVGAGIVVLVADDPGPISSQTEQDTRQYGIFSKMPVLDPSDPEEAYHLMRYAFELSEKHNTPVIIRPTTRVCHATASFETAEPVTLKEQKYFEKDPRWVIFPALSYQAHLRIEDRNPKIGGEFSRASWNQITGEGELGIVSHGTNHLYLQELRAEKALPDHKYMKVTTPFPFPEELGLDFLRGLKRVLVVEELSPYLETQLLTLAGKYGIQVEILGKLTGHIPAAGENSVESLRPVVYNYLGLDYDQPNRPVLEGVSIPVRPPVLCAGCPHRGAFYAIKQAMKDKRCVFTGDIGCYTLGNAKPLEMVDTCLCMGAGITIAQGLARSEEGLTTFAFIGDSTFFHSGITGVANAVYNQTDLVLVVLDNLTTAMTGKQPHPGTGFTMMQQQHTKIDIPGLLKALGVSDIEVLDPFQTDQCIEKIQGIYEKSGVRALVFDSPCIKLFKPSRLYAVSDACIGCKKCVRSLGCPALVKRDNHQIQIDPTLCYGCSICEPICPTGAISEVK